MEAGRSRVGIAEEIRLVRLVIPEMLKILKLLAYRRTCISP